MFLNKCDPNEEAKQSVYQDDLFQQKSIIPDCIQTGVQVRSAPLAAEKLVAQERCTKKHGSSVSTAAHSSKISQPCPCLYIDYSFRSQSACRNQSKPFMVGGPPIERVLKEGCLLLDISYFLRHDNKYNQHWHFVPCAIGKTNCVFFLQLLIFFELVY